MSDDYASIEISAGTSRLDAGLRRAMGAVKSWANGVKGVIVKGVGAIGPSISSSIGNVVGQAAGRGMDFVVDQAKSVQQFEMNLTRLGIAGGMSSEAMNEFRAASFRVSTAIGIAREELLGGTQTYVDLTGDIAGATKSMETFARVSQASGASVSDVAAAAAGFKGIGVELEDMEETFGGLIAQGKAGAVSLKDFAGEIAKLAPRWAKFNESTTTGGISQLGAAFQIARQGFGSASEAATGLSALMGSIVGNAKKFEAAGVKVFDKNPKTGVKTLRTFEQIMSGIENSKLVKDPTLMKEALGSTEALQTMTMIQKSREAVDGQATAYQKLVDAGMQHGVVQKDLTTVLESSGGKMAQAWEQVKNAVAEAMTPERIEAFVDIVKRAADAIGAVIEGLGDIKDYLSGSGEFDEDNNPFSDQKAIVARTANPFAPVDEGKEAERKAQNDRYHATLAEIDAAGTRKDQLKRAVQDAYGDYYNPANPSGKNAHQGDATWKGREAAASAWMQRETNLGRMTPEKWEQARGELQAQAFIQVSMDRISAALEKLAGAKTEVQIDGNAVATANSKSTNDRRKP
jgi:hypothetical protein